MRGNGSAGPPTPVEATAGATTAEATAASSGGGREGGYDPRPEPEDNARGYSRGNDGSVLYDCLPSAVREEDSLFDASVTGPGLPFLLGLPPSTRDVAVEGILLSHAISNPETTRYKVKDLAVELTMAAGCPRKRKLAPIGGTEEQREPVGRIKLTCIIEVATVGRTPVQQRCLS